MSNREGEAGGVSKTFAKLRLEDAAKHPDMSSSQVWESVTSRRSFKRKTNQRPRLVCIDVLNFAGSFFKCGQKKPPHWDKEVTKARKKVKHFVKAARNSNIEIIGFIDKSVATEEAIKKWRGRRQKELCSGRMKVIPLMNLLLGSIMQEQGLTIHYSTIDCDDTIAAFAFNLGADVLSQDSDFFRYYTPSTIKPFNIFSSFTMAQFLLTLTPHPGPNPNKQKASKREILTPLPDTRSSTYFLDMPNPVQMTLSKVPAAWETITNSYTRGCGTNLPQMFTNPHLTIRPLRQALYSTIGVDKVMEVMATWNTQEKKPEFREEVVMADPGMVKLLNSPEKAVALLFQAEQRPENCSSVGWRNQLFAQRAFVAEICAWATGTSVLEILEMLTKHLEVMVTDKDEAAPKKKKGTMKVTGVSKTTWR